MLRPTDLERRDLVKAVFGESLADHANSSRFRAYFEHYCSLVCPVGSTDAVINLETPAISSHADVLDCISIIVRDPKITFNEFAAEAVDVKCADASIGEKEYVARVAVEAAFLVNCVPRDYYRLGAYYSDRSSNAGRQRARWEGNIPFLSFMENAFGLGPQHAQTPEQLERRREVLLHKSSLKAWKLIKRCGIKIRATDSLLEHLALDKKTMTLKVFHHVSFLRAHLAKSREQPLDMNFEQSLRRGTLPPRLLIETLLTFHDILFPVASVRDKKSRAALEAMIQKKGFDPEARLIEFIRLTPSDMGFDYLGDRLSALYNVVKSPPPENTVISWLERHTTERNALTVAIVGLFLSVLFGLLSFIVGLLQLLLAWEVYKNPPGSSS